MKHSVLLRDERGAAALEFAFAVPVMFTMIIGATQLGTLFYANAGVKHAVAEGARVASVFPFPGETAVRSAVSAQTFGLEPNRVVGTPSVVRRTDANGNSVVDITLNYSVPLDFKFFSTTALTLSDTRTVILQTGTETTSDGSAGGTPTPSPTATSTPTPSPTSTSTPTPSPTATSSPSPTPSPTPTCTLLPNGRPHPNCH